MIKQLAFFLALAASTSAIELSPENFSELTDGKTVFLKVSFDPIVGAAGPQLPIYFIFMLLTKSVRPTPLFLFPLLAQFFAPW